MEELQRERSTRRVSINFEGQESRTKQSFAAEANINNIVERWRRTGEQPVYSTNIPQYGDFSSVQDYMSALNTVRAAQEMFEALPARVRDAVKNSPEELLRFVANPENREQAEELGLFDVPPPTPEPVVEPPKEPEANPPV